jgi:hypothetical protein
MSLPQRGTRPLQDTLADIVVEGYRYNLGGGYVGATLNVWLASEPATKPESRWRSEMTDDNPAATAERVLEDIRATKPSDVDVWREAHQIPPDAEVEPYLEPTGETEEPGE